MKITAQKIFTANVSRTNFVFVKLYTDDGIEGVGEATLEWKTLTIVAALEELERVLIGKDPFQSDAIIEQLHRDSYWRTGRGVPHRARRHRSGAARHQGQGARRAGVRTARRQISRPGEVLCQSLVRWRGDARRLREERQARRRCDGVIALSNGIRSRMRASKWIAAVFNRSVEVVAAVRDAVGPDVDLMLDVHGRFNVPTAISMCKAMAPFNLAWIEEPVPPEAIDALADVRAHSPVPIAAGERGFEPKWFLEAIEKKAVDILQPDVSHVGGMAETKRVAHLAHWHMIPVAPHNPVGPVMNAMTLHASVALPNFMIFETVSVDVPWRKELVRETLVFDHGDILVPTAPGLGVELNEEACAKYPYQPFDVPLFDGSINRHGVNKGDAVMRRKE